MTKVESDFESDECHEDDLFTIEDHALYSPKPRNPAHYFTYTGEGIQGSCAEANAKNGNVYTIPNDFTYYGTSISGVTDTEVVSLHCTFTASANYEDPSIMDGSSVRPAPMDLTFDYYCQWPP